MLRLLGGRVGTDTILNYSVWETCWPSVLFLSWGKGVIRGLKPSPFFTVLTGLKALGYLLAMVLFSPLDFRLLRRAACARALT